MELMLYLLRVEGEVRGGGPEESATGHHHLGVASGIVAGVPHS